MLRPSPICANRLDHPIWSALTLEHARFADICGPARSLAPDIGSFAAAADTSDQSLNALLCLARRRQSAITLMQGTDIVVPNYARDARHGAGVQMVLDQALRGRGHPGIVPLYDADAPDMLRLAKLTQPGPFEQRTHVLGQFYGIRHNGQLIAMAGQRLAFPGYREVSGVCVHPAHLGQGLATALVTTVATDIQARGETVFLHAYANNTRAIGLYERMGFRLRRRMHLATFSAPRTINIDAAPMTNNRTPRCMRETDDGEWIGETPALAARSRCVR